MLKLDFTIPTSTERTAYVSQFTQSNPDYKFTPREAETIANYILYGKDSDGTSAVDRHDIEIETKYSSWAKRKMESLEGLMEAGGQSDGQYSFEPAGLYKLGEGPRTKRAKPTITEKDEEIPGMAALAQAAGRLAEQLNEPACEPACGLSHGLTQSETTSSYTAPEQQAALPQDGDEVTLKYKRRHLLIALRRERYYLKESHNPPICGLGGTATRPFQLPTEAINWDQWWIGPMGLYIGDTSRFRGIGPHEATKWDWAQSSEWVEQNYGPNAINFADRHHIYKLAERYTDLAIMAENDPGSMAAALVDTLDWYVDLAQLSEERRIIWDMKIAGANNEAIRHAIAQVGKGYSENYISTIFKQGICGDIAAAAQLNYDEYVNRDNGEMWKICSGCGRRLLKDTRRFMRKSTSSDGFSGQCKDCERIRREKRKAAQRSTQKSAQQLTQKLTHLD